MVYLAHSQNPGLLAPYIVIESSESPVALVPAVRAIVASLDPHVPLRDVATMSDRVHRSTAYEIPRTPFLGTRCAGPAAGGDRYLRRDGVPRQSAPTRDRHPPRARRARRSDRPHHTRRRPASRFRWYRPRTVSAIAVTRSLSALLYQVDPRDPAILGAGAAVLATTALIACVWPAVRAVRVDPSTLLREE